MSKIILKMLKRKFLTILIMLLISIIKHYKYTHSTSLNHVLSDDSSNISLHIMLPKNEEIYENKEYPPSVIVWTYWRSGSTFFGELLQNAHENTFYDYEPMLPYGNRIYRDENEETDDARRYLSSLLRCYMTTHKQRSLKLTGFGFYRRKNKFFGDKCKMTGIDCKNTTVISNICKSAKYHAVKLLRLSLVWAHSLLSDPALDIKIIYLVRDPRPVIRDCSDPVRVCSHIQQDIEDAMELKRGFPDKFHFIRYEDLSMDVLGTVEELWKKLYFNFTEEQREQIKKLTTNEEKPKSPFQVSRNTAAHTFSWRESMDYKLMRQVQDACIGVLDTLGLRAFQNIEDYENYSLPVLTKTAADIAALVG